MFCRPAFICWYDVASLLLIAFTVGAEKHSSEMPLKIYMSLILTHRKNFFFKTAGNWAINTMFSPGYLCQPAMAAPI